MKWFSLELISAAVNILIDRLERFKVIVDHLLSFAITQKDFSTKDDKSILWSLRVEPQLAESGLYR